MPGPALRSLPLILTPDASRTVIRPFLPEDPPAFVQPGHPRAERILARVMALSDAQVAAAVARTIEPLRLHHRDADETLLRHYEDIRARGLIERVSADRALLIGAYFSEEYAFEAAALFNPSIVPHADQSGLDPGAIRFILSLRGVGEGHLSSVTFRTGVWQTDGELTIDPPSPTGVTPRIVEGDIVEGRARLEFACEHLSETVLFPVLPRQAKGIEDLRLVQFANDDGSTAYLGTYTAYDGQRVRQELLEANSDFTCFTMSCLEGAHMDSKGLALFPRKLGGGYAAVGRPDNENLWLLFSDDLKTWREGPRLFGPEMPWEFIQIGNCGSPIELDEGWLLLTHGVGTMRSYAIGAALLDRDDPTKVLGRSRVPLLQPFEKVQGGYVPNVVYSCGALVHEGVLLLPHGIADYFTGFATVAVENILHCME